MIAPPGIAPDPAKGFEVWRSMQHGAAWNHILEPEFANLLRDQPIFVSWWTPGQYLIPGIVTLLPFGLSLGLAATLTTFVAMATGIFGWYTLYREFAFSKKIALLACALLAMSPGPSQMFSMYLGGAVLLFGVSPWAVLLCIRIRPDTFLRATLQVVVFLCCFMLKSAFLTVSLAACIAMAILGASSERLWRRKTTAVLVAAAIFLFTYLVAFLYLRQGATPSDLHGYSGNLVRALLFPLAGPLLGAASADIGLDLVFGHTNYSFPEWTNSPLILGAVALTSLSALCVSLRYASDRRYRIYTLAMFGTFAAVHAYLYIFGARVGCNAHYFQIPGLFVLPGALNAVQEWPRTTRRALWAAFVLYLATGPIMTGRLFVKRFFRPVGIEGFSLEGSPMILETLHRLDNGRPERTALIELGDPTWSIEIRHQRWFVGRMWQSTGAEIRKAAKRGLPAELYVVVPQDMLLDGRAKAILESHLDVPAWSEQKVEGGAVYFPRDQEKWSKKLVSVMSAPIFNYRWWLDSAEKRGRHN